MLFRMMELTVLWRWVGRRLLVVPFVVVTGCVSTGAGTTSHLPPAEGMTAADSVIVLRRGVASDPLILERNGVTVVLSLKDVEAYYAQWTLPPDVAEFRDEIRRRYAATRRVELEESELADILAARLIESGQAAIRRSPREDWLPWVRAVTERIVEGSTVVRYRVFYAPNGILVLRALDGVTVS